MDDMLELIKLKIKKYKRLHGLNILLSSVLTLVGTVSVFSLLMLLHNTLGLGIGYCFLLAFFLPQMYSVIVNAFILEVIDDKARILLEEIVKLEEEYELKINPTCEIKNIELRFDGLSIENKLKVLNFVKERLPLGEEDKLVDVLSSIDIMSLDNTDVMESDLRTESGYSRKRLINDEKNNQS